MVGDQIEQLRQRIRNIVDFPKKGIVFRDITTLLMDPAAFRMAIDIMYDRYADKNITKIVAIESRGFIFGSVLAYKLNAGFIPVRKPNKLPSTKIRQEYQLEYGVDALEIHTDAIAAGDRVLVVDDLLATGGTSLASCTLVESLGGTIAGLVFLIELTFLNGKSKLKGYDVYSIISYDTE